MATATEDKTVTLIDGTKIKVRPLKISLLRPFMKKFEDIANWAQERYGIDILDKEDIAWKTKYPKVAKKIDELERRLHYLEERHIDDGR